MSATTKRFASFFISPTPMHGGLPLLPTTFGRPAMAPQEWARDRQGYEILDSVMSNVQKGRANLPLFFDLIGEHPEIQEQFIHIHTSVIAETCNLGVMHFSSL